MGKLCVLFVVAVLINGALGQGAGQNQFPGQNQRTTTPRTPTTTGTPGTTTMSPEMRQCITDCPATSEYNPVCGTDNVIYPNHGRLTCAQMCGVNVSFLRTAPCPMPPTTPQ